MNTTNLLEKSISAAAIAAMIHYTELPFAAAARNNVTAAAAHYTKLPSPQKNTFAIAAIAATTPKRSQISANSAKKIVSTTTAKSAIFAKNPDSCHYLHRKPITKKLKTKNEQPCMTARH